MVPFIILDGTISCLPAKLGIWHHIFIFHSYATRIRISIRVTATICMIKYINATRYTYFNIMLIIAILSLLILIFIFIFTFGFRFSISFFVSVSGGGWRMVHSLQWQSLYHLEECFDVAKMVLESLNYISQNRIQLMITEAFICV